jgi:hypothetical protein
LLLLRGRRRGRSSAATATTTAATTTTATATALRGRVRALDVRGCLFAVFNRHHGAAEDLLVLIKNANGVLADGDVFEFELSVLIRLRGRDRRRTLALLELAWGRRRGRSSTATAAARAATTTTATSAGFEQADIFIRDGLAVFVGDGSADGTLGFRFGVLGSSGLRRHRRQSREQRERRRHRQQLLKYICHRSVSFTGLTQRKYCCREKVISSIAAAKSREFGKW